jgi:hypothetical protein
MRCYAPRSWDWLVLLCHLILSFSISTIIIIICFQLLQNHFDLSLSDFHYVCWNLKVILWGYWPGSIHNDASVQCVYKKEANQHTRNCVVEYAVYVRYTYRHAPLCTIPPTCVVDQQLRLDLEAYWFFDKGRRHIDASKEYMHELGEKKSVWSSFCYAYNTHGAREGDTESLTFTICAVQPYTTAAIQTLSLVLTPCSVQ